MGAFSALAKSAVRGVGSAVGASLRVTASFGVGTVFNRGDADAGAVFVRALDAELPSRFER